MSACAPSMASSEFFGREPQADVDLVAGVAQLLESGVGDLFGYQYSRHRTTFRLGHSG